jgi:hypothetical protein
METELAPIRTRAKELLNKPKIVDDALAKGAAHAGEVARKTMKEVKQRMGLT